MMDTKESLISIILVISLILRPYQNQFSLTLLGFFYTGLFKK